MDVEAQRHEELHLFYIAWHGGGYDDDLLSKYLLGAIKFYRKADASSLTIVHEGETSILINLLRKASSWI